eukprot:gnl/MRDRNA2_/MRDRNA2_27426_c0_seq1.p1 gnl/MRDRNA2_/MRDRNA2_27426_c0~~gnl/MRDRNA2_/MRDRNA2_27426_c0_seq1.p1  ORF type:complete len:401 (-),score=63.90 gnl/MRDRNA2_/MRDRNA2_27426_c0_seq1:168-1370(-)
MSFLRRWHETDVSQAEHQRICEAVIDNEALVVYDFLENGGTAEKIRDADSDKTMLHLAAFKGHSAMLGNLLKSPRLLPLIDSRDRGKRTPLHLAAAIGDEACVRILIAAGAKLSCQDKVGSTPLHLAVKFEKLDVAQALLELGADPMLEDKERQSSKDLAECSENSALISLMKGFASAKRSGFSVKSVLPAWVFSTTPESEKENHADSTNLSLDARTSDDVEVGVVKPPQVKCKSEHVACRGPGHVACSHCFYTDRFGRHKDCTRACAMIDGSWGPSVCVPECSEIAAESVQQMLTERSMAASIMHQSSNTCRNVSYSGNICRGPGHVRCNDCFYNGRFGRNKNCRRQCSMIAGSWGPSSCVPECRQPAEEKQETESELTCVPESERTNRSNRSKDFVEE